MSMWWYMLMYAHLYSLDSADWSMLHVRVHVCSSHQQGIHIYTCRTAMYMYMYMYIHVHVYMHVAILYTYTCIYYSTCAVHCTHMYPDLGVVNGVFSKARPVKGHPVLMIVQVHCLYPPCVEPTLTLCVQACCDRQKRERGREGRGYVYTYTVCIKWRCSVYYHTCDWSSNH